MFNRIASARVLALAVLSGCCISCGGGGNTKDTPISTLPTTPTTPAAVAQVSVVLSAASANVGQTVQGSATVRDAAGNALIGRAVSWSSTATSVATVSSNGLVTAVAGGSAQISATSEGITGTQTFTALVVAPTVVVDSIVLSFDSTEVTIGDTVRLVAVPRDAAGHALSGVALQWTSTNPTVATVSQNGLVTSLDIGNAEIDVVVAPAIQSTSNARAGLRARGATRAFIRSAPRLVITPSTNTLDVGQSTTYTARITDSKGTLLPRNYPIRWSVNTPTVASIDQNGGVKALKKGTTKVIATVVTGVGGIGDFTPAGVTLNVTVCGGLMDIVSWNATVSSSYAVTKSLDDNGSHLEYTIDQGSNGVAQLFRIDINAAGDSVTWKGPLVSGAGHINNKALQFVDGEQIGAVTEVGASNQFLQLTEVTLSAHVTATGSCAYSIRYEDYLSYVYDESPKPPGQRFNKRFNLGISGEYNHPAGIKPPAGWLFNETIDAPGVYSPSIIDSDPAPLFSRFYAPVAALPALMILQSATNVGFGKFAYVLTPR
ncbi:MAG: Ig-like domain-containing protein [Gemmatimonadaceae bacterium]